MCSPFSRCNGFRQKKGTLWAQSFVCSRVRAQYDFTLYPSSVVYLYTLYIYPLTQAFTVTLPLFTLTLIWVKSDWQRVGFSCNAALKFCVFMRPTLSAFWAHFCNSTPCSSPIHKTQERTSSELHVKCCSVRCFFIASFNFVLFEMYFTCRQVSVVVDVVVECW